MPAVARRAQAPFADGDQLLLYTDGVIEARDEVREYFPLLERVPRHICDEPSRTLAALHDELLAHVGDRLHDDAALLLLRKPVAEGVPATAEVRMA
ncbi:SpoIIE family protein phosphatase [Streptomyces sp. NPDC005322]|uniref:SpoIIE family protein phosphatase n=1 Tax=Streptomyces sp. NPDC005322 TaxID=3157032 RepID=UPI0033B71095